MDDSSGGWRANVGLTVLESRQRQGCITLRKLSRMVSSLASASPYGLWVVLGSGLLTAPPKPALKGGWSLPGCVALAYILPPSSLLVTFVLTFVPLGNQADLPS